MDASDCRPAPLARHEAGDSVSIFEQAWNWLSDSTRWSGASGIPSRLVEHLVVTGVVMLIALLIALPLGVLIGHSGRGITAAVSFAGGLRALPTLGLVTMIGLWVGIGLTAPVIALVVLAVPPVLAGVYAGIQSVDRAIVDSARAIGMSELRIVATVEMPLAARSVMGGLRSATLQVVSTVTVAAYIANVGLGRFLFAGLSTQNYGQMLGGALLVIALALAVDAVLVIVSRIVFRFTHPQETVATQRHAPCRAKVLYEGDLA